MKVLTITEEAFDRLADAADAGSWSSRAVTVLDENHNKVDQIIPGQMFWVVAEDPYECAIINIACDGTVSRVKRE